MEVKPVGSKGVASHCFIMLAEMVYKPLPKGLSAELMEVSCPTVGVGRELQNRSVSVIVCIGRPESRLAESSFSESGFSESRFPTLNIPYPFLP